MWVVYPPAAVKRERISEMNIKVGIGIFFLSLLLQGCASSDVSRQSSSEINNSYQGAASTLNNLTNSNVTESFSNSSQKTKGMLIGGATGAVAGGLTSGIGIMPGAAGGAIFGGALGAYIDSRTTLADQIRNRGMNFFILGDQLLIVIPSRRLFDENSANLSMYAYSNLDLIAKLISSYPNMSVNISGYTAQYGPENVNIVLSEQQAQAVLKYLWRRGINTRMLYAAGYGGSHPVEESGSWYDGENYRIEITLEKLPV